MIPKLDGGKLGSVGKLIQMAKSSYFIKNFQFQQLLGQNGLSRERQGRSFCLLFIGFQ